VYIHRFVDPIDDPDVRSALMQSSLRDLPDDVLQDLARGSRLVDVSGGTTTHLGGDPPFSELVVQGLIRAYVGAPNGRTMTIRYCRPGALMGTGTLFNDSRPAAQGSLRALVDSRLLQLRPATMRKLADGDLRVARALLRETSARVAQYINELHVTAFASARQRLARHLLDLAADEQRDAVLVASASQEELAAAVGTVREIVVRILHDFRREGLVKTTRGRVELLDPMRLQAETDPLRSGAN